MTAEKKQPGQHSLTEILSQPACWQESFTALDAGQLTEAKKTFPLHPDWLFIGCGTSYYLAQAAAAGWTTLSRSSGQKSQGRAVPASELLLYPELILSGAVPCQPVLISRSGKTSEVLKAAEFLEMKKDLRTLGITCAPGSELEKLCSTTLKLPHAGEQSIVMTRSFTSMLLSLHSLAAAYGENATYREARNKLPALAEGILKDLPKRIQDFTEQNTFSNYVFLGQGPLFGITSECMLKVKEMSCSAAECFHTLEYRHGPKSTVRPDVLITFLISETGLEAERDVLEEVKGLGGTTLVITNKADDKVRAATDFLVELNTDLPEIAHPALHVFAGQLLGLYTGLKKGLDPDSPPNLTKAVVLS